ncbi:MAG TPA: hypothetical protein PLK51_04970 [Bacteroidales bacterium]|nr:hypothetical protein [Bacteroidales bacterium]
MLVFFGKIIVNSVNSFNLLATSIVPLYSSIILLTIDSPNPVPDRRLDLASTLL